MNKQITAYVDEDILNRFKSLYPQCLTLFIRRAISACVKDRQLFERIFFHGVN